MDIIKSNIYNLTHLWKTVSNTFQSYFEADEYSYCYITNSQWPNRIWVNSELNKSVLKRISKVIENNNADIKFSYFERNSPSDLNLISDFQFTENSIQYGMSTILENKYEISNRIKFKKVEHKNEIREWCNAFENSFNYKISEVTLQQNINKTDFFLIYSEGNIAGTILLHLTDDVAGIHALGIIPEMRAKGIAREAMKKILNISVERKARYAVLQASEMAKKMYENMGFKTQFTMHNFQLKTK